MNNELLNNALDYSAIGLSVIPTRGKKPACAWKPFQRERPGPEEVRGLFNKPDITGVAVILGQVSGGLACRDFDVPEAYEKWAGGHGDLAPSLPTVETARGKHVYFRTTSESGIRKLPDGELRLSGGYCLLPPSLHPSGATYRWLIDLPDGEVPLVDPIQAGLGGKMEKMGESQKACSAECARDVKGDIVSSALPAPSALHGLCATKLQAIERAIATTQPAVEGQRHRCVFRLAQQLKGILPDAEPAKLRVVVQKWHRQALPVIGTKPFHDTWTDFLLGWPNVKFPGGKIITAFQRALKSPPPPKAIELFGEGPIVDLLKLCRELQRIAGDVEFFLDCRTAGRLIGVDPATAWRYLKVLCTYGFLKPGAKGSRATRKASQFRFIGFE